MKTTLIRGVPLTMQQDGWWLSGVPAGPPPVPGRSDAAGQDGLRLLLLVTLIALGDVLVWQVMPGLSLALFGASLVIAALFAARRVFSPRYLGAIAACTMLVLLPLVELVQPLSLLIALTGVSALLAAIAGLRPSQLISGAARIWPVGFGQTLRDGGRVIRSSSGEDMQGLMHRMVLGWLLPLGLGGLFVLLLSEANPILLRWLDGLSDVDLPPVTRFMSWLCLIPIAWTAVSASDMRERLALPLARTAVAFGPHREGVVNLRSVRRALVLFNAMFAVQTGLDIVFLYGGVGLPDGITYAEYAHRGAYPLLVTALLAGGFALISRPWTDDDATLRLWLMIWVAQNVALVVSSLVRLELYTSVYGLTHLRVWAAIWMAMVATGLGMVIWQVWQRRENRWLMVRCAGLGAAVLYVCAFVSFDAVVARYNTTQPVPLDRMHLCGLGDAAQPFVELEIRRLGFPICKSGRHVVRHPDDWREWGFRNWRARRSLAAIKAEASQ